MINIHVYIVTRSISKPSKCLMFYGETVLTGAAYYQFLDYDELIKKNCNVNESEYKVK